jgi:acetyl esterase/lipase
MMGTKSDPPDGIPLVALKPDLMKCRNVWFVGHSLGGAIALLTFVLYRKSCLNDSSRPDNARLISPLADLCSAISARGHR